MIIINNLSNKNKTKGYIFSDLNFSLENVQKSTSVNNNNIVIGNDIVIDMDESAVRNSIKNLLLQKRYTFPAFGVNLRSYVGGPLSEMGAISLGEAIEKNITLYEPRVKLEKIYVAPDYDNFLYIVMIIISLPNLGNQQLTLKSIVTNDGDFRFVDK